MRPSKSQVWEEDHNAIVIVWDENDYSGLLNSTNGVFPPNQNDVVLTVELNKGELDVKSSTPYTSFSLLKSLGRGAAGAQLLMAQVGN